MYETTHIYWVQIAQKRRYDAGVLGGVQDTAPFREALGVCP